MEINNRGRKEGAPFHVGRGEQSRRHVLPSKNPGENEPRMLGSHPSAIAHAHEEANYLLLFFFFFFSAVMPSSMWPLKQTKSDEKTIFVQGYMLNSAYRVSLLWDKWIPYKRFHSNPTPSACPIIYPKIFSHILGSDKV